MKTLSFLPLCCILTAGIFVSSCRTVRTIKAEKVRPMGAGRIYSMVTSNYLPYNTLSIKFDVNVSFDDQSHSLSGTLRIRKDSLIWVSITPALGIEAARMQFSPDSIMFMNRLKNEYFINSYDYFEQKFQTEISFSDLQSIFTDEIFLYSESDEEKNEKLNSDNSERDFRKTFIASTDSNKYVLKTHRKHKIKKYLKKNKTSDLIVETLKIVSEIFKVTDVSINDFSEKRTLCINYSDFVDVNSKVFPSIIKIDMSAPEKHFNAEIKYNKITVDSEVSFPFRITDKYKRIN